MFLKSRKHFSTSFERSAVYMKHSLNGTLVNSMIKSELGTVTDETRYATFNSAVDKNRPEHANLDKYYAYQFIPASEE